MKIGFIYSGYQPGVHSGIIRWQTQIVNYLSHRHDVKMLAYPERVRLPKLLQQYARILRPFAFLKERRFIKEHNFDVVVFQGVWYPEARSLFAYPKTKRLMVQHGIADNRWLRGLVSAYMHTFGKAAFRRVDRIMAISNYTFNKIEPFVWPVQKMQLVSSGCLNRKHFYPIEDKTSLRKKWNVEGPVISAVGRLVPLKNFSTLIKAMQYIDATLLIVGDGPQMGYLEFLASKYKVSHKVRLLGWLLEESDVNEIINLSDVSVLPSLSEGLGLVIIEALAAKVPVVAANIGGITDIVSHGQNGLLIKDPHSEKEIADKVNRLLDNPALARQLAANGYEFVVKTFDQEITFQKIEKLLQETAQASTTSGDAPETGWFGLGKGRPVKRKKSETAGLPSSG
jgi:glycosyltransferase involved in cell wall biosynthesis